MIAEMYSQVSVALLLGSVAGAVISARKLKGLNWLPILIACVALVPVLGLSIGRWIYSFTGPISLPLTILLGWSMIKPLSSPQPISKQSLVIYWSVISFLSLIYFPLSFGWTSFDPHAWGWQQSFVYVPCAIAATCICFGQPGLAVAFILAGVAWKLQLFDSTNGWTYLVDPIAACVSLFSLVSHAASSRRSKNTMSCELETATQGCSPVRSRAA